MRVQISSPALTFMLVGVLMNKPFVFLSTAMSLDGKITAFDHKQSEICTNDDYEMRWADRLEADAIMIGANQLRLDDPKLTMKSTERQQKRLAAGKTIEPIKVAVVSDLRTIKKRDGDFFKTGERKILFTTTKTPQKELEEFRKISEVFVCGAERVDLPKAMETLYGLGIRKVMAEGGGEFIFSLLKDKLVDEIHLKIGNLILGGRNAITFVEGDGFTSKEAVRIQFLELTKRDNYLMLKAKPVYPF